MKRKIISLFLTGVLLFSMVTPVIAASLQDQKSEVQDKIDEAEDRQDEVSAEIDSISTDIESLTESIAKYESELLVLNDNIAELENNIEEKSKEITKLQKEFEEMQQLLEDRLVAIYEEGQITFLDVLLSSENIWDYISMESRIQELTEADNAQMDEVENKRLEVEKAKNELEEEKTELDNAKKSAEAKQQELTVARNAKETQVANLSAEEKELQEQIDEYEQELKEIDEEIKKQQQASGDIYDGSFEGTLGWPLSSNSYGYNIVTSCFGPRNSPAAGASTNHRGIDLGVSIGTPVYASADGYVLSVMQTSARGLFVLIKHADDLYTRYQHLSSSAVSTGDYVTRGQLIARSGNTGVGSGPHLHFEVLTQPYYMCEINPLTCGLVSVPSNLIIW